MFFYVNILENKLFYIYYSICKSQAKFHNSHVSHLNICIIVILFNDVVNSCFAKYDVTWMMTVFLNSSVLDNCVAGVTKFFLISFQTTFVSFSKVC
jgi:hypothetical protein